MLIIRMALVLLCACILSCEVNAQQSGDGSIGEVFATDASVTGSVILGAGGTRVASGSSVSAGRSAASIRLDRGGEVRVCPGTSVSVTAAARSKGLMLSLSEGTIEMHYSVGSSADTIQTPDFRILFPGPGDFNFAVRTDARGSTCIRALEGNTASVVVAEMMGDGTYQVRPNEQITFSDGKVTNAVPFGKCGCAPGQEPLRANTAPAKPSTAYSIDNATLAPPITVPAPVAKPAPAPKQPEPSVAAPPQPQSASAMAAIVAQPEPTPTTAAAGVAAPPPPAKPEDVHVLVEVPMVYSADAAAATAVSPAPVPPAPDALYLPAAVYMALFRPVFDEPTVTPAPPPAKSTKEKKGFLGRLRSFFGGMFH